MKPIAGCSEDWREGVRVLEESIALARELDDRAILARSLAILGVTFGLNTSEPERAAPFLEEPLQLGWALEDTWSIGFGLFTLGRMALGRGDGAMAEQYLQECLAVSRRTHNTWGVAVLSPRPERR